MIKFGKLSSLILVKIDSKTPMIIENINIPDIPAIISKRKLLKVFGTNTQLKIEEKIQYLRVEE